MVRIAKTPAFALSLSHHFITVALCPSGELFPSNYAPLHGGLG